MSKPRTVYARRGERRLHALVGTTTRCGLDESRVYEVVDAPIDPVRVGLCMKCWKQEVA